MMLEKTGEERVLMGFSMFDFSCKVLVSSLEDISTAEKRKNIFLRLYRNDFSKIQQKEIIKRLIK
jgi:hypothetical protein